MIILLIHSSVHFLLMVSFYEIVFLYTLCSITKIVHLTFLSTSHSSNQLHAAFTLLCLCPRLSLSDVSCVGFSSMGPFCCSVHQEGYRFQTSMCHRSTDKHAFTSPSACNGRVTMLYSKCAELSKCVCGIFLLLDIYSNRYIYMCVCWCSLVDMFCLSS